MHTSNEFIWLHNDELNGFPKLYKFNSKDRKLLVKFQNIVAKLDSNNKKKLLKRIHELYSKYADNSRLVTILKKIETYLK